FYLGSFELPNFAKKRFQEIVDFFFNFSRFALESRYLVAAIPNDSAPNGALFLFPQASDEIRSWLNGKASVFLRKSSACSVTPTRPDAFGRNPYQFSAKNEQINPVWRLANKDYDPNSHEED